MRRVYTLIVPVVVGFAISSTFAQSNPDLTTSTFESTIAPFFKQHCVRCHGPEKQKAKRRFDTLAFPIADDDALIDFQDALDLINLAEMPPEDEPQPTDVEQRKVVAWLTAAIAKHQAERDSTGGETILRRLNRREYLNTISDLFGLNVQHFDPTEDFPADQELHHLDNQGRELVTSGFLLQKYLDAADQVVDKALPPLTKPEPREWHFEGGFKQAELLGATLLKAQLEPRIKALRQSMHANPVKPTEQQIKSAIWKLRQSESNDLPDHIRLYEHPRAPRHVGSYGFVSEFTSGVPRDGYYSVTVQAEARDRIPTNKTNYARIRKNEPLILAFIPGDINEGPLHLPQPREPELARFEMSDDGIKPYTARIWLDQGKTPRFIYVNGSHTARTGLIRIGTKDMKRKGLTIGKPNDAFAHGILHSEFPHIRIHSVSIRGPLFDHWPTQPQQELITSLKPKANQSPEDMFRPVLRRFLRKAWRRPITDSDINRILKVIGTRASNGVPLAQAYRDGIKAALCMPSFLYLDESTRSANDDRLNDHALASRLSYFLWSSMPDETLLHLADTNQLSKPTELNRQFDRMLADPKSDRFVRDFLKAWLNLGALGSTPPDINAFKEYYIDNLGPAMKQETFLYTRHILDNDLPIDRFIDSDFTFMNAGLARLYKHSVSFKSNEFKRVRFTAQNRGGLLGHSSVLTVTANGVDTSPIVRGVWILENILGTPPTPPPPDVEPLDPDIRGAKSIRDQLMKHRADPTCAECHRKIDPLGFALERFDAIGRTRGKYHPRGKSIDSSGVLPGGVQFKTFGEFKRGLIQQHDKFARGLTEKLLAYAVGRSMEISDRPQIDAILADLKNNDWRFRYLLRRVVLSPTFQSP